MGKLKILSENQRHWLRLLWGLQEGCADGERYGYPIPSREELNELIYKGLVTENKKREEMLITDKGISWLELNKLKPMITP